MKPETAEFIAYANRLMGDARRMLESGLPDHAARTAYLACFHAARAYAFERTTRVAKTHRGVQTEFLRLSREDARIAPDTRISCRRPTSTRPRPTTTPRPTKS